MRAHYATDFARFVATQTLLPAAAVTAAVPALDRDFVAELVVFVASEGSGRREASLINDAKALRRTMHTNTIEAPGAAPQTSTQRERAAFQTGPPVEGSAKGANSAKSGAAARGRTAVWGVVVAALAVALMG